MGNEKDGGLFQYIFSERNAVCLCAERTIKFFSKFVLLCASEESFEFRDVLMTP